MIAILEVARERESEQRLMTLLCFYEIFGARGRVSHRGRLFNGGVGGKLLPSVTSWWALMRIMSVEGKSRIDGGRLALLMLRINKVYTCKNDSGWRECVKHTSRLMYQELFQLFLRGEERIGSNCEQYYIKLLQLSLFIKILHGAKILIQYPNITTF